MTEVNDTTISEGMAGVENVLREILAEMQMRRRYEQGEGFTIAEALQRLCEGHSRETQMMITDPITKRVVYIRMKAQEPD